MMILKVFFSDDEIKKFFKENGYEVVDVEFGEWENVGHNDTEYVKTYRPAVMLKGKPVEARKLFEMLTTKRLKKLAAPQSLEMQRTIEKELKQMLKPINYHL